MTPQSSFNKLFLVFLALALIAINTFTVTAQFPEEGYNGPIEPFEQGDNSNDDSSAQYSLTQDYSTQKDKCSCLSKWSHCSYKQKSICWNGYHKQCRVQPLPLPGKQCCYIAICV
ncbi:hypothetical protein G9A89_001258 [Geosiphon pyriformis]|nr:hypothetical protein G9A89_001256 [Geosiphon pyriformis]KAG9286180.1 hypothetical protein G9A89_001258 [Geosiphon pyriformis]